MRPFRFLAQAASGAADLTQVTETARRAEALGFSGVMLPDHLVEQHAPVPVLATVAAVTERLRIGTFVLNAGLRHPAVLAQDLSSLDVLSGGRLEIGIGAGWNKPEYDAIGLPFPPASIRVARMAEAVSVLKGCFAEGPFSFAGEHFRITEHHGYPQPVQKPHPPFFIGGGGRRTLAIAAREANIIGLAPRIFTGHAGGPTMDPRSITAAATAEKIAWIREAAGDRFGAIELNTYPTGGAVEVTDNARAAAQDRADHLYKRTGIEISADDILESPHMFIGSLDGLTQKFIEMRERFGISCFMVGEIEALAPVVERLAGS